MGEIGPPFSQAISVVPSEHRRTHGTSCRKTQDVAVADGHVERKVRMKCSTVRTWIEKAMMKQKVRSHFEKGW
jgi:hypothetical protein